jgi:CIC family chloride channel protein
MTGDYRIILPLMLATVVSTLVARAISRESIYTLKLSRRGIVLEEGQDIDVMQGITVEEAMTKNYDVVSAQTSLPELINEFASTRHHGFPVINDLGELIGVVTLQDLERASLTAETENLTVEDIATKEGVLVAFPDEPMWKALKRLGARDIGRLPVVAHPESRILIGVLRRSDIIRAYNFAINRKAHLQHQTEVLRLGKLSTNEFLHLQISPDSVVVGKQIHQLSLPENCLVLSIRRGTNLMIARGNTTIQEGDTVTVFADQACIPDIIDQLSTPVELEALTPEDTTK